MKKEMNMRVNQPRKQRNISKVHDVCALRTIYRPAHGADAIPVNQHFARLKNRAAIHLQQARGMEHDGRPCRRLG